MFLFLPLFVFFILLYCSISKKGLDLGGYMTSLYVLTSACAIILHYSPPDRTMDDYTIMSPSLVPALVYCGILLCALMPYYQFNSNQRRIFLRIKNVGYFNKITYIYIAAFFVLIALLYRDIVFGILSQNLGELREEVHKGGVENALSNQSSLLGKLLGYGSATVGAGGFFMIFFFYYSICFTNNRLLHNILILVSSLSTIVLSIIDIDRSGAVMWLMTFLMAYFIFKPYLTKEAESVIKKVLLIIGGFIMLYLIIMTLSRFEDTDMGAGGSLISYVGQPYLNFCNVWDNVEVKGIDSKILLPFTNTFILHHDGSQHSLIVHGGNYVRVNGFYSYIGMIYLNMGHFFAIIVPLILAFFTRKKMLSIQKKTIITLKDILVIYMLGIVVLYGCISYFYSGYPQTMNLLFMILACKGIKYKQWQ